MKQAKPFLQHILDEINYLLLHSKDIFFENFFKDETLKRSFIRSLEIIGEATKNISKSFRTSHPEVAWKEMAGLRDILVHHYFGINYKSVWDIIKNKIPMLKTHMEDLLKEVDNGQADPKTRLKFNNVYQFKITLKDIEPPIWRRIQVPQTYSLWDLHVAIQDSMGWLDYHLHEFHVVNPATGREEDIGIPDDEGFDDDREVSPGWKAKMVDYFSSKNARAEYDYDFGDYWQHEIALEGILPADAGTRYPVCIDGQRACPPEDCGGTGGYEDLLDIIADPSHEDYEETVTWLGDKFEPEKFDPKEVHFDNPKTRLRNMLKG